MANVELVIEISEEYYHYIKEQVAEGITNPLKVCIANGTLLSEGHGKLKDADEIISKMCGSSCGCHLEECGRDKPCDSVARIISAPTIVKANK